MHSTTINPTATGFPHFSGGFCDDRYCAGSSAATYDGHWVWRTAADYARDHHANGTECTNPFGCDQADCHKAAREIHAKDLSAQAVIIAPCGTRRTVASATHDPARQRVNVRFRGIRGEFHYPENRLVVIARTRIS